MIGVLCAYLVKSKIKPKVLNYRLVRLTVWALLFGVNYAVFMYPHYLEENNLKANEYLEMLYPAIGRLTVSLFFAWWLYSMSFGYSR